MDSTASFRWLLFLPIIYAYTCPNTTVTVKFQGQPYFFPAQGSDDHYAANLNCKWNIQIPDGYYLHWGFHSQMGPTAFCGFKIEYNPSAFAVDYPPGSWDVVYDSVGDTFATFLNTNMDSTGTYRFNVTSVKKVPPTTPTVTTIDDYGFTVIDLATFSSQNTQTYTIAGDTTLQANSDCTDDTYLSEVWINYGTAVDVTNHRTLMDGEFWDGLDSANQSITLYSPVVNPQLDNCYTIVNDIRNIAPFNYYALHNTDTNYPGAILTESDQPDAETEYNPHGFVTLYNITWRQGPFSAVRAYNGVPTPLTYNSPDAVFPAEDNSMLPYTFNSSVVTFVMDQGFVNLYTKPFYGVDANRKNLKRSSSTEHKREHRKVTRGDR